MRCRSIGSIYALFGAITLVLACSDSTAPVAARLPGRYELATVLNTFTYSYVCTPTNNGTVCSDSTVAAGASKLYGTFTVGDTVQGTGKELQFPVSSIVLHQADCALSATQCSERVVTWLSGSLTVTRDSLSTFGLLNGAVQIYLNGRVVGDRIVGNIGWATYLGCCARRRYEGTFVATRQP